MSSIDVAVGLLDDQYVLVHCNEGLSRLLGGSLDTSPSEEKCLGDYMTGAQMDEIHCQLQERQRWRGAFPNIGSGVELNISRLGESSIVPRATSSGEFYLLLVSDRREFFAQKKEISRLGTIAEKAEKEKSDLVSEMGHELRTPLNAVLGFSQLLEAGPSLSREQQDYVSEIMSASNYLLKLIGEILTQSKTEHDCTEIKLLSEAIITGDLVSECVALVEPLARKGGIGILHLESNTVLVKDRVRMKQILLNLLSNAIKYNYSGGRVVVQSFPVDGKAVYIEVQDSGRGIPSEQLDTIFKPFERLAIKGAQIEGSGIGLMITRRLATILGGKVRVVSEPESGSVFSLQFPVNNVEVDENTSPRVTQVKRILWIGEDSASTQFAERLTALRPNLEFVQESEFTLVDRLEESFSANYVFIEVGILATWLADSPSETSILLQRIQVIVVTTHVDRDLQAIRNLDVFAVLKIPFSPIDYLHIVDLLVA